MRDRKEVAEFVYRDLKEMQRATFDIAAQWGRWLLASLLLIHGGALFGLFSFLTDMSDNPAALRLYAGTVWWFVIGLLFTLGSGLSAWANWSMHSDNYEGWASPDMLWDPAKWMGDTRHGIWINVTYWSSVACGAASAACIAGGANSILHGEWFPVTISNIG